MIELIDDYGYTICVALTTRTMGFLYLSSYLTMTCGAAVRTPIVARIVNKLRDAVKIQQN